MTSILWIGGALLHYVVTSPSLEFLNRSLIYSSLASATISSIGLGVTNNSFSSGKNGQKIKNSRWECIYQGFLLGLPAPLIATELALCMTGHILLVFLLPRKAEKIRFYYYRSAHNQLRGWNGRQWVRVKYEEDVSKGRFFSKYGFKAGKINAVDDQIIADMEAAE